VSSSRWHSTVLTLKTGRLTTESKRSGRNEMSGITESKRERKRYLYPALVAHCVIFRESPVLHNMNTHIYTTRSWGMLSAC